VKALNAQLENKLDYVNERAVKGSIQISAPTFFSTITKTQFVGSNTVAITLSWLENLED
jgi:hypothetical protein